MIFWRNTWLAGLGRGNGTAICCPRPSMLLTILQGTGQSTPQKMYLVLKVSGTAVERPQCRWVRDSGYGTQLGITDAVFLRANIRVHENKFPGELRVWGVWSRQWHLLALGPPVNGLKWRMGCEEGKREDIFQASTCGVWAEGMRAGDTGLPSSVPFLSIQMSIPCWEAE